MDAEVTCSLKSIKSCPSARIIKVLLSRLSKYQPPQQPNQTTPNNKSTTNPLVEVLNSYNYSVTEILNDLNHIKYEHNVDRDDTKFDESYEFFKKAMSGTVCNVNSCPHIRRHYRNRGRLTSQERVIRSRNADDALLMDTMAMVHCYFLHSFDLNRLTKEERDSVEMEMSADVGLDDDEKECSGNSAGDTLSEFKRVRLINNILTAKTQKLKLQIRRGGNRYRGIEDEEKSESQNIVDFVAMAKVMKIDANLLSKGLSEYGKDRDRLIADLIDVVYAENPKKSAIWTKLKIQENVKSDMFQRALFQCFECTQLNTANFVKLSAVIVKRESLQIDMTRFEGVISNDDIDGRMFDKNDKAHYQNMGAFSKRFKTVSDCKPQHARTLYRMIRKWQYIEKKDEVKVMKKEEAFGDNEGIDVLSRYFQFLVVYSLENSMKPHHRIPIQIF